MRRSLSTALRSMASVTIEGVHHLDTDRPYILALNHLSVVDALLVFTIAPRPLISIAASKLRRHRSVDWFLGDLNKTIYVGGGVAYRSAIQQGITALRSGNALALCPEGQVSRTGAMKRGHHGVAHLASGAQVPVIPMAMWGQETLLDDLRGGRRSAVRIRFGDPIPPPPAGSSGANLAAFTQAVMAAIAAMLPEIYRGAYADHVTTNGLAWGPPPPGGTTA